MVPLRFSLTKSTRRKITASRWFVYAAQAAPPAVPILLGVGFFLLFSGLGGWRWLPGWLHLLGLIACGGGVGYALWRYRTAWIWPTQRRAIRWLERRSGLAHHPILSVADAPQHPTALGEAAWQMHQQQAQVQANRAAWAGPQAAWARYDPYKLRYALVAAGVLAAFFWPLEWRTNLKRAFAPNVQWAGASSRPVAVSGMVTPLEYTGRPSISLTAKGPVEPIIVPAGSRVQVSVSGPSGAPALEGCGTHASFAEPSEGRYHLETTLTGSCTLSVGRWWRTFATWPVRALPDASPSVTIDSTAPTERGSLGIAFRGADDYGIVRATAYVARNSELEDGTAQSVIPIEVPLKLPKHRGGELKAEAVLELAWHEWAGRQVLLTLEVEDAVGQRGRSMPVAAILPVMEFHHPLARQLIGLRKHLYDDERIRGLVGRVLARITTNTKLYQGDWRVYMPLASAVYRLLRDARPEAVDEVKHILWQVAVLLEHGRSQETENALRDTFKALEEALESGASASELDAIMQELWQKLGEMAQDINSELQQQQPVMQLDMQPLEDALNAIRQLYQTGAKEEARQLAEQLRKALEQAASPEQMQQAYEDMQQMQAQSQALKEITEQQEALMERTHRQQQAGQPPTGADAEAQNALGKKLGDMMQQMREGGGQPPESLDGARKAMGGAGEALAMHDTASALEHQAEALRKLREGQQSMAQQFAQKFGGKFLSIGQQGQRPRPGNHGRPLSNYGNIKLPERYELQRSKQILDELFRRSQDGARPDVERQYIDRLLEEFR